MSLLLKWPGDMSQLVQYLSCNCEHLSLISKIHVEKLGEIPHADNYPGRSLDALTRQPSILGEFQGDKRPCVTIMGTTTELSYLG